MHAADLVPPADSPAPRPSGDGPPDPPDARPVPDPGRPADPGRRRRALIGASLAIVVILGGSALFVSGYALGRQGASDPGTPGSEAAAFQPFWDTYHTIVDRYAGGPVDRTVLISGAIRGMISSLGDPFSSYLSQADYQSSLLGVNGQFEGIGAQMASRAADGSQGCTPLGPTCRLLVVKPIAGSPASNAGIQAGDIITTIDGSPVTGLTVDAARDRIRGARGTVITLGIERAKAAPFELTLTRDVVQQPELESETLAGGTVGYHHLVDFSDRSADLLAAALQTDVAAGRTRIVLDLRGDLGGYVTAARKVASQFIGSGVIFWEEDASGTLVPTTALADGTATDPKIKVVCLIDGGSASASEIVAGALQDTRRAILVGQQSYGKGTMQQWSELTDGGGAFKLTVAKWLTPDQRWIHKVGLTPDVVVPVSATAPIGTDPTLDRALQVLTGGATG